MDDKIYIKTLEIAGFIPAIKGMRNPMNSWNKSDSVHCCDVDCCCCKSLICTKGLHFIIGDNDMKLAKSLVKAGNEHSKFLRQIQVWADVKMPRYWWSEADTYKFGTKNSCSTMHKLLQKNGKITTDDFLICDDDLDILNIVIDRLNDIMLEWNLAKEELNVDLQHECLLRAKRLLPESYLQLRTWNTNYQELMSMYKQRCNHRLKYEWVDVFCSWCETLPYFNEICLDK